MDEKIRYIRGQINGVCENAHMLKGVMAKSGFFWGTSSDIMRDQFKVFA